MEPATDEQNIMTRYLLGEMSEAERSSLETAYFSDDASVEKLEFVRDDLIDRYAGGRLSGAERKRFESHFLESPHHRRKLAFATTLIVTIETGPATSTSRSALIPEFLRRRRAAFALAAALMLLAIGSLFLLRALLRVNQQPAGEIANKSHSSNTNPQPAGTREPDEPNLNQNRNDRGKGVETRTLVASLDLTSRDRGSQGQSLVIAEGIESAHLLIARPPGRYRSYTASISPVDGKKIWSQKLPAGSSPTIVLKVPAKLFSRQDYVLTIRGVSTGGHQELVEIAGYSFRVEGI